jgi:catechol 2,3-dioxygenase-like lactoylglutathione lyase family enzyme
MAAQFLIDHVVIRVDDLAAAIRDYTALGFTVTPGGEHPGLGSHNALIPFADGGYLELIAYRKPGPRRVLPKHARAGELTGTESPMERHVLPWETAPEGLIDYALLPSAIDAAIAEARQRGLQIEGPIPGGRLRPDGQRVEWQLGVPSSFDLPFLCTDVTPRPLRVPEGPARQHANGASGIQGLIIVVNNLAESTVRYRALLGQEPWPSATAVAVPGALVASFTLGPSTIRLAEPTGEFALLNVALAARGEGPVMLSLAGTVSTRASELDRSLAHQAIIRFHR